MTASGKMRRKMEERRQQAAERLGQAVLATASTKVASLCEGILGGLGDTIAAALQAGGPRPELERHILDDALRSMSELGIPIPQRWAARTAALVKGDQLVLARRRGGAEKTRAKRVVETQHTSELDAKVTEAMERLRQSDDWCAGIAEDISGGCNMSSDDEDMSSQKSKPDSDQ